MELVLDLEFKYFSYEQINIRDIVIYSGFKKHHTFNYNNDRLMPGIVRYYKAETDDVLHLNLF